MRAVIVVGLLGLVAHAHAAPARVAQDDPHPGIHRERWEDGTTARIHLVRVDLTSQEIALYATKESDSGLTPSGYADRIGAQVVINGDSFRVAGYVPRGLAIGDSTAWTNTRDDEHAAVLHLRRIADGTHERTAAAIAPPELVVSPGSLPQGTQGAVSGRPLLVRAGAVATSFDCGDPTTLACTRAPRSAVAISEDGNTMWLAVVDGWQSASLGMTAAELAGFLRDRGAHMAMGLDSGSSSALVVDQTLVSAPSDGTERRVANHLAVKFGALPRGQLVGVVCRDDVIACRNDSSLRLPGATVTLDDGRVHTVASDAFYTFANVTPRLACVTAKKAGFQSKHQCQVVESGSLSYNSVALVEGEDPPGGIGPCVCDASPPDHGGNHGNDAGRQDDVPPPAGCCGAGGGGGAFGGSAVLSAICLVWVRRRRVIQTR
ncbi:MAG: phosphodiester glycosidase family protein [Deltaproteobacteria bacterium]|nr:phosphodiester glycosidase family protein [Deltaproteobacteria bacterium]MCW5807178.1 phosphodiester glycosidase family protein [Deltaproteobacteria bacterium]